ncbi:MAG TPA: exodeoxyribonuclease III [Candidatus Saccharimonadia bacterium]|nr:exodeoxyribonuclease III [Candidatus Saccharimonadia bacterium]
MRIASWNVNSLKARLDHVTRWIGESGADVLALQEIKLIDEFFPHQALEAAHPYRAVAGQKTYNGVAILSRRELHDVQFGIPGYDDPQRRVVAATVDGVRIVNVYVVNGEAVGSTKFAYKLEWMARVRDFLAAELARFPELVVLGDFNVTPDDRDVHDPKRWNERVLCSTPERKALGEWLALGLHDSFRLFEAGTGHHTWWDYRLLAYPRGWGLRIDLVLVSDALRARVVAAGIERGPRTWERPSDHCPVFVELQARA